MTIKDLKPALVFGIFDEITKVPRPSVSSFSTSLLRITLQ